MLEPICPNNLDPQDKDRALHFFAIIARFEYALKASGYAKRKQGRADVDTARFNDDVMAAIDGQEVPEALNAAIAYLCGEPPKIQLAVQRENGLIYAEYPTAAPVPNAPTVKNALNALNAVNAVKQVRNNLFHGGKYMDGGVSAERNRRLIECSLRVLEVAVMAVRPVHDAYMHG